VDQEQVRRLDVPVDDPARVRRREALGRDPGDTHAVGDGERLVPQPRGERLALEPLHREGGLAVRCLSVRHIAHDTGVLELGEGAGLTPEAPQLVGVGGGCAAGPPMDTGCTQNDVPALHSCSDPASTLGQRPTRPPWEIYLEAGIIWASP
jgi:hypothetical protein